MHGFVYVPLELFQLDGDGDTLDVPPAPSTTRSDSTDSSPDSSTELDVEESPNLITGDPVPEDFMEMFNKMFEVPSRGNLNDTSGSSSDAETSLSEASKKDIIMAHLLRLACYPKGPYADHLDEIASELFTLGLVGENFKNVAAAKSIPFDQALFSHFGDDMLESDVLQFWKPDHIVSEEAFDTKDSSRYLSDFDQISLLGNGSFGSVVLCRHKLDDTQYAIKVIKLGDETRQTKDRILREVSTLSKLHHQHVVRYYQAWFEKGVGDAINDRDGNKDDYTYLYIQMEHCPSTLLEILESDSPFDTDKAWTLSSQIVNGIAHIHMHGIIHRDLSNDNVFLDDQGCIKIGDFGLDGSSVSSDDTSMVGKPTYMSPEMKEGLTKINEKTDMYSFGILLFEIWYPFGSKRKDKDLEKLKNGGVTSGWATKFPKQSALVQKLISSSPSQRPSASETLKIIGELRPIHPSEVTSIFDQVMLRKHSHESLKLLVASDFILQTEPRDQLVRVARQIFINQSAECLEVIPMRILGDFPDTYGNNAILMTREGDLVELSNELRLPFAKWIVANQKSSFKRYDISYVYRRSTCHSPPNRYLQGDFDIIGGETALTEAEVIKASIDIPSTIFHYGSYEVQLNHADLLEGIWCWTGVNPEQRYKVAKLLSLLGSVWPQTNETDSKWRVISKQLSQELNLAEIVVKRLQTVRLECCGPANEILPKLRLVLPVDESTTNALKHIWKLLEFLEKEGIEDHVLINSLMLPTESYHRNLYFQIYWSNPGRTLIAIGGRYDHLLRSMGEYKSDSPGAVGTSVALETILKLQAAKDA